MKPIRVLLAAALFVVVTPGPSSSARAAEDSQARVDDAPVFPRIDPAAAGINLKALEQLKARAEATKSDAVVIVKDGKLVADWSFGHPRTKIEAMSATKSIVSLAVGLLIDTGKIKSLDQPVWEFYPEWNQGRKQKITVRHLLNHTSGLQHAQDEILYERPDFVRLALAAELSEDPGSKFSYNNKAVNLLAGIIERASGKRMDRFIGDEIFSPMGITDFGWSPDKAGNPHGMAGLQITAIDLAKIGQLVLDEGQWRGRQILSREWIRLSTSPSQTFQPACGLLWWRVPRISLVVDDKTFAFFKEQGMTADSLERLETLRGKPLEATAMWSKLRPIVQQDEVLRTKLGALNKTPFQSKEETQGKPRVIEARGYLGQMLTILPDSRIVAVRQRQGGAQVDPKKLDEYFSEFWSLVEGLVQF
jgi:CubicO group peptidase (beta-lactamase class C family)